MKDANGRPVGVLAHEVKTHITESGSVDMLSALNKDFDDIKIEDQLSNEDILSYTYPREQTNKQTLLEDAVDTAEGKEKYTPSDTPEDEEGQFDISSRINTSNTGLMD